MEKLKNKHVVLIVHLESKDVEEIEHLFNLKEVCLSFTFDLEAICEEVNNVKPSILIFCIRDINIAQELMLDVIRNSNYLLLRCCSILFTSNTNVKKANKLCIKGIFDDYVMFWPNYDVGRINFAVHKMLFGRDILGNNVSSNSLIKGLVPSLESSCTEMGEISKENDATFSNVKNKMDDFLTSINQNDVLDAETLNNLNSEIRLIKSYLMEAISGASKGLDSANSALSNTCLSVKETVKELGYNVLLIDDDCFVPNMLNVILQNCNLSIKWASNMQEGIKVLNSSPVDLVLLDYNMPDITGMEGLRIIKNVLGFKSIPVVMLTGTSAKSVVESVIEAGANDFIVKPPKKKVILSKLSKHINGYSSLENID